MEREARRRAGSATSLSLSFELDGHDDSTGLLHHLGQQQTTARHSNEVTTSGGGKQRRRRRRKLHNKIVFLFFVFSLLLLVLMFVGAGRWSSLAEIFLQRGGPIGFLDHHFDTAGFVEERGRALATELHPADHVARGPKTIIHHWKITAGTRAPDGVSKEVYLIDGRFIS